MGAEHMGKLMKHLLVFVGVAAAFAANTTSDWPTGNRTTPPTINSVSPRGVPRGTTTELTVEGLNLAKASAVFFSEPGIQARILRIKELPDLSDVRLGSNAIAPRRRPSIRFLRGACRAAPPR